MEERTKNSDQPYLTRIMATMDAMTSTTSTLFTMLNQCTLPPGMRRYASQRDAHLMLEFCQYTSYVYTTLPPSAISCELCVRNSSKMCEEGSKGVRKRHKV